MQKVSFFQFWKQKAGELKRQSYALYLACRDPRTPWYAKAFSVLVVAYAFSPIDLIPDFIPVLGYLDDLVLIPLGVFLAVKMIPQPVMAECQVKAGEILADPKNPQSRIIAVLIVCVWALVILLLGLAVFTLVRK